MPRLPSIETPREFFAIVLAPELPLADDANETLGAQQLVERGWQMVSRTDEETRRILNDVIQLCVLVNPNGMDSDVRAAAP